MTTMCLKGLWLLAVFFLFSVYPEPKQASAQSSGIPEPMPVLHPSDDDLINIVLLGSDTSNPRNSGRTDVILIVSINLRHGSAALLSVPRDLYVYVPGWKMQRINTAYAHGETMQEGQGPETLFETLRFNLGLEVDHYARVDFNGFKQVIDAVGGVDITVDCAIEDWRLRQPDLDPTDESSWEMVTLPIGLHHMDGDLALWYARSRRTSSDLDRGRRQQDLIRALWRQIHNLALLPQLAEIWPQVIEVVETDLTLTDMLTIVSAGRLPQDYRLTSYTFRLNEEVIQSVSPDRESVLVPQREAIVKLITHYLTPPTHNQLESHIPHVLLVNASGDPDLVWVAADLLAWEGFEVVVSDTETQHFQQSTEVYDYTGQTKGSRLTDIQSLFSVTDSKIIRQPDTNRQYDYQIVIGSTFYPCNRAVIPPSADRAGS